ncbi:multidrug effflux MFS transporter [Stakelama sp. CBK3Z-3]|uniref:Bcr/CflA family efflux transporter n=1 Tax=Stakelama flava TaxID=2860338 RepID=A0ABS6XP75_9SPHN|nr:multidrug effflux MFS transporter [Stakelama flava]MBW4331230.1 multidrug effflux MFS transporter [Stakelama flava]
MEHRTQPAPDAPPIALPEFVALVAAMMALTALGIDSMLPALPAIGATLNVAQENDRQFVITAFLLGFAVAQLAHGPLSDRFGRRPVLACGLIAYAITNIVVALSGSFALLLIGRFAAGTAVAAARVVTIALVRDCFSGRAMARVMSLAFIVFMAAPVLAPSFGELVLLFANWRFIFGGVALVSLIITIWFVLRMPETLPPEKRLPLSLRRLFAGYRFMLADRYAVGYTLAAALLTGGLFGFIGSVQQIVFEVLRVPHLLVVIFASIAGTMAVGSYFNSRIVMHFGTRLISHSALTGFFLISAVHLAVAWTGHENIWTFAGLQALAMACFGLASSNFSSMAMEHMGEIAGTASSLQGFTATMGGALIGAAIGQQYDGSTVPLYTGFLITSGLAFVVILVAERGRLFRPAEQ